MRSLSSMKDFEIFFRCALFRHRRRLEFQRDSRQCHFGKTKSNARTLKQL